MSLTRVVARPLLASVFIHGGVDALRHPESKVKAAEQVAGPIADRIPGLPDDTETLVRLNGAVMVGAGALLATGKFRRVASIALLASLLPTTYAGHRFWEETDDTTKAQQQIHFLKNLGLIGGLILAAVDTEGRPSLTWRAKRTARLANQAVSLTPAKAGRGLRAAKDVVATGDNRLAAVSASTGRRAGRAAVRASERAQICAQPVVASGMHRAGQVWSDVAERLPVG
jgi:putative oxidoreductase